MCSPVLMLFLMLLLLSPSTLLVQGKGQGKGRDKARREETTEVKRPERAKKSKAHQKHAKKKGVRIRREEGAVQSDIPQEP